MAEEHGGGGGSPYTFLFLLVGVMVAAVVFKAVHTGIPLTTALMGTTANSAAVTSAPAVTETAPTSAVYTPPRRKRAALLPQDHWTTITLDQDGRVMSIVHY